MYAIAIIRPFRYFKPGTPGRRRVSGPPRHRSSRGSANYGAMTTKPGMASKCRS